MSKLLRNGKEESWKAYASKLSMEIRRSENEIRSFVSLKPLLLLKMLCTILLVLLKLYE
jgi:hypothetical protein